MNKKLRSIVIDAMLLAILVVCGFIKVQLEVSFTLQVFAVFVIAFLVPLKDALLVIAAYLVMGLIGIPVFTTGGGIGYVLQPTFGYLLGFIVMPLVIALFKKIPNNNEMVNQVIGGIVSIAVLYLFGSIYFYLIKNVYLSTPFDFAKVISICVIPFIPFDILKLVVAVVVCHYLKPIIKK